MNKLVKDLAKQANGKGHIFVVSTPKVETKITDASQATEQKAANNPVKTESETTSHTLEDRILQVQILSDKIAKHEKLKDSLSFVAWRRAGNRITEFQPLFYSQIEKLLLIACLSSLPFAKPLLAVVLGILEIFLK